MHMRAQAMHATYIVPGITTDKDHGNYGSSATRDVEVLQAVSRRIHFGEPFGGRLLTPGMFVSEPKFQSSMHVTSTSPQLSSCLSL